VRRLKNPLVLGLFALLLGTAAVLIWQIARQTRVAARIESDTLDQHDAELGYKLRPNVRDARIVIPAMPLPPSFHGDLDTRLAAKDDIKRVLTFTVDTNNLGLRGPDAAERKPRRTYRVLCLGDSTTFGWGVTDEQSYPRVAETTLAARDGLFGRRGEFLNAGVPGYTLQRIERYLVRDLLALEPDLVTVCSWGELDRPQPVGLHRQILERLARLSREQGFDLAFLCPPRSSFDLHPLTEEFRQTMIQVAAKEGVLFVDFAAHLEQAGGDRGIQLRVDGDIQQLVKLDGDPPETLLEVSYSRPPRSEDRVAPEIYAYLNDSELSEALMLDDGHPNAEGHRLMGEHLAQQLTTWAAADEGR
jgi:lysophospholipase L1-like esterase